MNTILCFGDSFSGGGTLGVPLSRYYPAELKRRLTKLGCRVRVRGLARSGRCSDYKAHGALDVGNLGQRIREAFEFDKEQIAAMATILIGANDPGSDPAINTATTTMNMRASMMGLKFGADEIVDGQANLPAASAFGARKVVYTDTSTTGGAALPSGADGMATITGAYTDGPSVWECRYGAAGELGWGRVATSDTDATHISRLVVISLPFLNYSGGDTLETPYAAYNDTTGVRKAQIDAAAAEGAVYCNLHAYLKARIVAGVETINSYSWHVADGNQHLNAHGHSLVAELLSQTIQAQTGWLDDLKA